MSLRETYRDDRFAGSLASLRANQRRRRLVILGGALVGLALGSLHWLGLVLGGALVAIPARTIPRGLGYGLLLSAIELLVFAGLLAWQGALGAALTTGMIGGITVVIGLAAPVGGSLVRAVV